MSINLYFFDIDGCLQDSQKRINRMKLPKRRNKKYASILKKNQTFKKLISEQPIKGMQEFYNSLPGIKYCFTSRGEELRDVTETWLATHFDHHSLFMRKHGDYRSYAQVKEEIVLKILKNYNKKKTVNVIIFDDDPRGLLVKVCKNHGWNLFKGVIYGAKH